MREKTSKWRPPACDSWDSAPLRLHVPTPGGYRPSFVNEVVKKEYEEAVKAIMAEYDQMEDLL